MKCRHCKRILKQVLIDLGESPMSNSYILKEKLYYPEKKMPLKVYVCNYCWLVQTIDTIHEKELFSKNYPYLSSYSNTWLIHLSNYTNKIVKLLKLNKNSLVIEIASNDGCLLENFKKRNIPCFGIEPTTSTANISKSKGIHVYEEFFSSKFAKLMIF